MFSLLLALVYVAFISLGLPDALLGSAWTVMRLEMNVPLSFAGIVSMIIAGGTITSSLLSDRLTKRFGAGLVTAASVFMTAAAMFGFSFSNSFWLLCVFAVPYGLGAGAVDAALNNYVALHYASRHMSWLHCCWGVGAVISPFIMGFCLTNGFGWHSGYRIIGIFQIVLTAILFISLPLWKRNKTEKTQTKEQARPAALKLSYVLSIKGVKYMLTAFCGYCALEQTAILWSSSYLVINRGISPETAATFASYFLIGMTAGRFLSGFIADKIGDGNMIRAGLFVITLGIIAVWFPVAPIWLCLSGLIIIGLGCAPIYPAIIHSTPSNFGKENSQAVIGVQMASAYTGTLTAPPLFGLIANYINISLYPAYLLILAVLVLLMTEKLNKTVKVKRL